MRKRQIVPLDPLAGLIEPQFANFEKALRAEVYPLHPGPLCKSCGVREHCAYGKTLKPTETSPPATWPGVNLKGETDAVADHQ